MEEYKKDLNVDRLITFCSLVTFVAIQNANRGYRKQVKDKSNTMLENQKEMYKLKRSMFSNIGRNRETSSRKVRRPYKNLR